MPEKVNEYMQYLVELIPEKDSLKLSATRLIYAMTISPFDYIVNNFGKNIRLN